MSLRSLFAAWLLIVAVLPGVGHATDEFTVLAYHDVTDGDATTGDIMTIGVRELIGQFAWLKEHGYRPVSLDDIAAARAGTRELPDKAVLLTFDDGYRSVYTHVYPLLRLFEFPAVIALVGSWMETPAGATARYGNEEVPREHFLTWEQVEEMSASGLVEVASHTYDMHRGIVGNPQGNEQAAATTRRYLPESGRYESADEYLQRVRADLARNSRLIETHTGKAPRAIAWPYGSYNQAAIDIAAELGMTFTMGLGEGRVSSAAANAFRRILIPTRAGAGELAWALRRHEAPQPVRVVHVDLDYVYDADPARQERNLGQLVERVRQLQVNTVYLQAYADPDGNGGADALYFPNRHLPARGDLFNRAAWQLRTRAGVRVYAWMPVLAFDVEATHPLAGLYVQGGGAHTSPSHPEYRRLSPFHPEVRDFIGDLYEDLAIHADFAGILFHDDAMLTDHEDASPWALEFYRGAWDLPQATDEIRASPEMHARWSRLKTQYLIDWTTELAQRVRAWRPEIMTARNLFAGAVLDEEAERWLAQSLPAFLESYDYVALMAMPFLEGAAEPEPWLRTLTARVAEIPGAMDRTVFELQTVDWRSREPLGSDVLAAKMQLLKQHGVRNFGYYPEDFVQDYPDVSVIRPAMSLSPNPYRQP